MKCLPNLKCGIWRNLRSHCPFNRGMQERVSTTKFEPGRTKALRNQMEGWREREHPMMVVGVRQVLKLNQTWLINQVISPKMDIHTAIHHHCLDCNLAVTTWKPNDCWVPIEWVPSKHCHLLKGPDIQGKTTNYCFFISIIISINNHMSSYTMFTVSFPLWPKLQFTDMMVWLVSEYTSMTNAGRFLACHRWQSICACALPFPPFPVWLGSQELVLPLGRFQIEYEGLKPWDVVKRGKMNSHTQ